MREPPAEATAASQLPLPSLTKCPSSSHPMLPAKWTAKALLHPFYEGEPLALADLTYDASVGAIYQTNEWADGKRGSWLVTTSTTYQVTGPPGAPTGCSDVGPLYKPPGRDWLDASAQCVGVGFVQGRNAAWWKTQVGTGSRPPTTWYWYDAAKGTPWRAMFAEAAVDHGVLGMFSFIHFQQFQPVEATILPRIVAFCRKARHRTHPPRSTSDLHAMDSEFADGAARSRAPAARPKVDFQCNAPQLPVFQSKFGMTTLMSSVSYNVPNPLPTRVYYDSSLKPQSMRTQMYDPGGVSLNADALLLGGNGYLIQNALCELVLPGIPVPTWQDLDRCACRAAIRNDPEWNQYPEQWVIECPLEAKRVFWMWYTPEGIPIVFMETAAPVDEGTSLALADYVKFAPGAGAPGAFKLPASCPRQAPLVKRPHPRLFHHAGALSGSDPACHRCHEPLTPR